MRLYLRQEGVAYSTIQQEEENSPSDDSPANQTVAAQPMRSLHTLDS